MKYNSKHIVTLFVASLFIASLAIVQPSNAQSREMPFSIRFGQGLCVTMPQLRTTYIASSLTIPFEKIKWLHVRLDGSLDLTEDNLGNKDYIIGAVPTAQFNALELPLSPFIELACGVNYVSDIYLSNRALGSHILFSPTVSGGVHLSKNLFGLTLAYTFRHLSNSSMYEDNDGINFQYVTVSFGF